MIWFWFILMHCLGGLYAWLWRNQNQKLFYALLLKKKDLDELLELSNPNVWNTLSMREYLKQKAILERLQAEDEKLKKEADVIGLIWTALRTALPPIMIVLDIIFLWNLHRKYTDYVGRW